MSRINILSGCLGLALVLLAGCSARRSEPLIGPLVAPDQVIAEGELAFDTYCSTCHPGGEAGLGVALNNKPLPRALIKFQIRHGLGAMPKFPEEQISDQQRREIAAYLVWLRRQP
jgi:mono/diheme cytochrome c family protein